MLSLLLLPLLPLLLIPCPPREQALRLCPLCLVSKLLPVLQSLPPPRVQAMPQQPPKP
jgi:hypothetical protein